MTIRPFLHIPPPPSIKSFSDVQIYMRRQFDGLFQIQRGKLECVGTVTLTINSATTLLKDVRLSIQSVLIFDPTTANAAAELAAGTMYVLTANRASEQFTITNANNAQADRTFQYAVIG